MGVPENISHIVLKEDLRNPLEPVSTPIATLRYGSSELSLEDLSSLVFQGCGCFLRLESVRVARYFMVF